MVEHGEARVFELTVSPTFEPRQLKNMGTGEDAIVAAIIREGQALVPRGDDRVLPGDRLVVFCTHAGRRPGAGLLHPAEPRKRRARSCGLPGRPRHAASSCGSSARCSWPRGGRRCGTANGTTPSGSSWSRPSSPAASATLMRQAGGAAAEEAAERMRRIEGLAVVSASVAAHRPPCRAALHLGGPRPDRCALRVDVRPDDDRGDDPPRLLTIRPRLLLLARR